MAKLKIVNGQRIIRRYVVESLPQVNFAPTLVDYVMMSKLRRILRLQEYKHFCIWIVYRVNVCNKVHFNITLYYSFDKKGCYVVLTIISLVYTSPSILNDSLARRAQLSHSSSI